VVSVLALMLGRFAHLASPIMKKTQDLRWTQIIKSLQNLLIMATTLAAEPISILQERRFQECGIQPKPPQIRAIHATILHITLIYHLLDDLQAHEKQIRISDFVCLLLCWQLGKATYCSGGTLLEAEVSAVARTRIVCLHVLKFFIKFFIE
jgi:hypothetical protein